MALKYFPILVETLFAKELLGFPRAEVRSSQACCDEKNVKSCLNIQVDASIVGDDERITIYGIDLDFSNTVDPHGFVYKNSLGDEAVISIDSSTKNVFGSMKTHDGRSFSIEKCSTGHVWKEYDVSSFGTDDVVPFPGDSTDPDKFAARYARQGVEDNSTIVTYSVMFYYTPEFASITSDIAGYIDQVIAETNQGYENSGIPVRVSRFCIEAATINDIADTGDFISAFANMKGSSTALRNSADSAALLAKDFNSCGVAYLGTYNSGWTVSIATKSCALGYFSFGHELGHNYGSHHNPEVASNSMFSYGHGHLIAAGNGNSGVRTILAYSASGHSTRVNYYSNPAVSYPSTGTPTGVTGVSNNAAVITENRFAFAALGDESATCNDGFPTPSTTATTSGTAAPSSSTASPSTNSTECGNCVFPFMYGNRIHDRCTIIDGDAQPWCSTTYDWQGSWEYCQSSTCPGVAAPTETMSVNPSNAAGSCCEYCHPQN